MDERLLQLFAEMLKKQDVLIDEMRSMKDQQTKTNLAIGELRLSVIRLADEIV